MRPAELADHHTGTNPVVRHALGWFLERGIEFVWACCVYATAPFLAPERLQEGFERLTDSGASFAFSATTFAFPIQRALRVAPDGSVEPLFPESIGARSQDLEEVLHDAGQFYWGTADAFLEERPLYFRDKRVKRYFRTSTHSRTGSAPSACSAPPRSPRAEVRCRYSGERK